MFTRRGGLNAGFLFRGRKMPGTAESRDSVLECGSPLPLFRRFAQYLLTPDARRPAVVKRVNTLAPEFSRLT